MNQSELDNALDEYQTHHANNRPGPNFKPLDLTECDISGLVVHDGFFREADCPRMVATYTSLVDSIFEDADVAWANMDHSIVRRANFRHANMARILLTNADAADADFRDARLMSADLRGSVLDNADFRDANLANASLAGTSLRYANLDGAYLAGADLRFTDLTGVDLRNANLEGALIDPNSIDNDMLNDLVAKHSIVPASGEFTGYKGVRDESTGNDYVMDLTIPKDAQRIGGLAGRICRTDHAMIDSIKSLMGTPQDFVKDNNSGLVFSPGDRVTTDHFETDPTQNDASGVKFFMTGDEAVSRVRLMDEVDDAPAPESLKIYTTSHVEANDMTGDDLSEARMVGSDFSDLAQFEVPSSPDQD